MLCVFSGIRRHFSRRASSRKTDPEPLSPNDVRILRDKAERSSNWSNDPDRTQIEHMTVDEAAAIMLYTQGNDTTMQSLLWYVSVNCWKGWGREPF